MANLLVSSRLARKRVILSPQKNERSFAIWRDAVVFFRHLRLLCTGLSLSLSRKNSAYWDGMACEL